MGKLGVEENASKIFDAPDAFASAAVLNASGAATGQGSSLFVINLCASQAPIANVGKSLPGLESYRLYQVSRREDGRTRHRLRLGFFTTEADAENVLNSVRAAYPTAFTTCLCEEDRRFARGFVAEPSAAPVAPATPKIAVVAENKAKPSATATAPQPTTPVAAKAKVEPATSLDSTAKHAALKPVAKAVTAAIPAATSDATEIELSWDPPALKPANTESSAESSGRKDVIEKPSNLLATIELTLESEPAARTAPAANAPSNEPFRVSKGADIPTVSLTLDAEPAKPAAKPSAPAPTGARTGTVAKPAPAPASASASASARAATATRAPAKPVEAAKPKPATAAAPTPPASPLAKQLSSLPDLDSTQTIRALTSDELSDDSQEKWFAIQLAVSDQPVNLDAMPRLDIFEAYRLYSVANAGSGKITHCLRIGFFREEVSAEAVCGYLKTFFNSPTVVRISIAEQARFKDPPSAATGRSPSAASAGAQERPAAKPSPKADAKVLDLSHARERTAKPIPTVTMAVETPRFDPNATGSFKANATGTHKALATGSHQALNATGKHKALNGTGTHQALRPSGKSGAKASTTGKHKALQSKKSLSQQLLDEAREVELSASGIRQLPKNNSLLSKMFGKRK